MTSLLSSLARHPRRWLMLLVLVAGASVWSATHLRLHADLLSMLPVDVRAAQAYRTLLEEFGGLERIFVVVTAVQGETPTATAGRTDSIDSGPNSVLDATLLLEERLSQEPLIASVRAGVEPSDERFLFEFVVPREVLRNTEWTPERVAETLTPEAIEQRVRVLRDRIRSPVNEFSVQTAQYDPLGFSEETLRGQASELGLTVEPLSGLFQSSEGSGLIMVEPVASELDAAAGRELAAALNRVFAEVQAEVDGQVEVLAAGGPLYAAEDERLIRSDLESTISLSITGCLLVLLLAFGSWRAALVATGVLAGAFALAFGSLTVLRGDLLAVSLGFAAVLVGLGIDYVIHAVTRFRQGLQLGSSPEQSLVEVARESGPPLLASALTTAAGFSVLLWSAMRPLVEIGLLVSVGILSMLVCTLLIGGPLMVLVVRGTPTRGVGQRSLAFLWAASGHLPAVLIRVSQRWPKAVLTVTLVAVAASAWAARDLRFVPKFEDLRPDSHPLERAERRLADEFDLGEDAATVLVSASSLGAALDASRVVVQQFEANAGTSRATASAETNGGAERAGGQAAAGTPLAGVSLSASSPADLLLSQRLLGERLKELAELPWAAAANELERQLPLHGLSPRAFAPGLSVLRAYGQGQDPELGSDLERPDWITSQISHKVGEATVAIRLRTDPDGSRALATDAAAEHIASLVPPGTTAQLASAFALGEQLRVVGERETGLLAMSSLLIVCLLVAIAVKGSPGSTVLALLPIGVGAVVAFGLLSVTSGRLDFLSLAIVPMLFGIGIDDGLHALCGEVDRGSDADEGGSADEEGRGRGTAKQVASEVSAPREVLGPMLHRIEHAKRAITLTTLTTAVGFGSLGISSMPGLRTGGLVVAVGVVVCWLTTIMVLPAIAGVLARPAAATTSTAQALPSHAPEISSRWRRLLGDFHFSSPRWYRLHAWTLATLPSWVVSLIMAPVLLIFYCLLGNVRRALVTNQRAASGPSGFGLLGSHWQALKTLYQFAWCFSETYEGLFDPSTRSIASVEGEANWLEVTGEQGPADEATSTQSAGFIIATAHVGHWEVGSHLSKFENPRKVHVVREPEMNPEAQAFLEDLFSREGSEHYQVHFARADDPMLGGRLLSALRRGEILALQGDRPRAGGKTISVRLLGRHYELPLGPFAMARAARVPILPVFVFRDGRRQSALHLRTPIHVTRSSNRSSDFEEAAQRFAAEIEWAIRQRPNQWFCLRTLWES